ncbi:MAG TPA: ferredoxin [Vicinamibacteria bacterium]|jgi:ferredoxin
MIATGERLRANAFGQYYVTDECNGCGICASYAPENFASSFDGTYYAVLQQPVDDSEEAAVRDAMDACPLHCILADGDTL